ncbi:MAG: glycerol-3-phosphate 1-O-acyltransferase PlsY [Candidatus Scatovivens sp.]
MISYIIIALIGYLIGSVNFSVLISKKIAGFDVREKGSKNAGSTNVLRTVGKKAAIITLICDILKGVITIFISILISKIAKSNVALACQIGAIEVAIGHTYPIFFGFKGGKGVATSLGIILVINWKIGLICLIFALAIIAVTRMVSLGSISAAVLFAILTIFISDGYISDGNYIMFGILLAGLVLFNHRNNISRIVKGEENRLSFKKTSK